jgi:hypothetical protein
MLPEINLTDIRHHQIRSNQTGGDRSKAEKYRNARVERLRELYTLHEPELKKVCIYEHPSDARHNCYGMFPADESAINSPFDLPDFEDMMPSPADFNIQVPESSLLEKLLAQKEQQ